MCGGPGVCGQMCVYHALPSGGRGNTGCPSKGGPRNMECSLGVEEGGNGRQRYTSGDGSSGSSNNNRTEVAGAVFFLPLGQQEEEGAAGSGRGGISQSSFLFLSNSLWQRGKTLSFSAAAVTCGYYYLIKMN